MLYSSPGRLKAEVFLVKKTLGYIVMVLRICMTACSNSSHNDEDIGGDWHVWGLYSFEKIDDITVAVDQVNDEEGNHIGYDIYMDGDSLGRLLGELRCTDGGYTPRELKQEDYLVFKDFDGDGKEDVGMPLANGDILWYTQYNDEKIGTGFEFSQVEIFNGDNT